MLHQLIRVSNVDRAALDRQANPVSDYNFKLFKTGRHRNYYFGNIHYDTQPDQMCGIYREGAVARAYFHEARVFIQEARYESQPGQNLLVSPGRVNGKLRMIGDTSK